MNILKLEKSIALLKPIIWKMPMNEKRDAYITLLTAAQKQIPQEVNLVEFIGIGILFSICLGNYIKERTTSTLLMFITYIILVIIKILK